MLCFEFLDVLAKTRQGYAVGHGNPTLHIKQDRTESVLFGILNDFD